MPHLRSTILQITVVKKNLLQTQNMSMMPKINKKKKLINFGRTSCGTYHASTHSDKGKCEL